MSEVDHVHLLTVMCKLRKYPRYITCIYSWSHATKINELSYSVCNRDVAEEELGLAHLVSSYTLPHKNSQPGRRGQQTACSKVLSRCARDMWSVTWRTSRTWSTQLNKIGHGELLSFCILLMDRAAFRAPIFKLRNFWRFLLFVFHFSLH